MELRIETFLKEKEIHHRIIKLNAIAFSVQDLVNAAHGKINVDEVCKTIIVSSKKSDKTVAILLRGNDKLDFAKLKIALGEPMEIATKEKVFEVAGVEPGAVCPFLLTAPLFVDAKVLQLETLNTGSADHYHGLEFKFADLSKGIQYEVADLVK